MHPVEKSVVASLITKIQKHKSCNIPLDLCAQQANNPSGESKNPTLNGCLGYYVCESCVKSVVSYWNPPSMAKSSTSSKDKKVDPSQLKGRRFGRVLTKLRKLTRDQVHEALAVQKVARKKGDRKKIGEVMLEMGLINESEVLQALSGQAGLAWVELDIDAIPQIAFDTLPAESATTYQIVPVDYDESSKVLTIALKSPDNFRAVDDLRLLMGFKVTAVVSPANQIDEIIKKQYSSGGPSMADMMADLDNIDVGGIDGDGDSADLSKLASAASHVLMSWVRSRTPYISEKFFKGWGTFPAPPKSLRSCSWGI